jgi:hypothetical protein
MSDVLQQHAFSHAPAALRIFRFAADSAPRVLELAHVSAFLRECAVEFGSADATLPGSMRNEYAAKRFFELRAVVECNAPRCPWLAAKLLACRSGAPVPVAAMAHDVMRHDVNWSAEGARRHDGIAVSSTTAALSLERGLRAYAWAQGAVGVTSGKHFFSVSVTRSEHGDLKIGWVDRVLQTSSDVEWGPGNVESGASGAVFAPSGFVYWGTAPISGEDQFMRVPRTWNYANAEPNTARPCTVGCLLDADAGEMTVFVDGEPLAEQCEYRFPTDRDWFPSVGLGRKGEELFSNVVNAD